jgi:hypothetical protein
MGYGMITKLGYHFNKYRDEIIYVSNIIDQDVYYYNIASIDPVFPLSFGKELIMKKASKYSSQSLYWRNGVSRKMIRVVFNERVQLGKK